MKKKIVPLVMLALLAAACGEEKRDGQLNLTGSAPVRIVDKGGAVVNFVGGPLHVEFGADGSRKFTVKLEQAGRSAEFSGKAGPDVSDWNFTVKGRDIGQPVDFASKRTIALYGPIRTSWGEGSPCGFNGRWQTEESWQSGNEDWTVGFSDAQNGQALGTFASARRGESYLIAVRNTWCRERPDHEPRGGGRWGAMSEKLNGMQEAGVKFQ